MKYLLACFLFSLILFSFFSCEPEEDIVTSQPKINLTFSADTVLFDTVFVKTGSVTKRLLVYNQNKNAVEINEIKLGKLQASAYRIIINGVETPAAQKVRIRGGDSLYVLVKVLIEPGNSNTPFLVNDSLVFTLNNAVQDVKLVAYGQNAYFYRNQELTGETSWKADKPHVIYGAVLVKAGGTLTIEKGARIYAHKGAAINVDGTLRVEGTAQERVSFTGDRLEPFYDNIPGLWRGIRFFTHSKNNLIRHADIKNAEVGIWAGNPDQNPATYDIQLENCTIRNMFRIGILSFTSDIQATNILITNCGEHAVAGFGGGSYHFTYCTIANYTPEFNRQTPSFAFTDRITLDNGQNIDYPIKVIMVNSIVWAGKRNGRLLEEIAFVNSGGTKLDTTFNYNILQTQLYFKSLNKTNIFNEDPKFKRSPEQLRATYPFDYSLDTLSVANGAAKPLPAIKTDLKEVPRDAAKPDIGAYERIRP